jgi:hypothetical protein
MSAPDIAAKHDNRPGYKLVSFSEVGLPFFRVTASALIQTEKSLPPIEEFVMKSIDAGLESISEISGFLGMKSDVIKGAVTNLIQETQAFETADGFVELSQKGKEVLANELVSRPSTETIVFDVDGLTRNASWFRGTNHSPADMKKLGLFEVRAFPARRPEAHELHVENVDRALKLAAGNDLNKKTVLRVREVFKAKRFFYEAVALVFRSLSDDQVQMAFAIDGRISEPHELAFAAAGGISKLGIEKAVLQSRSDISMENILGIDISHHAPKVTPEGSNLGTGLKKDFSIAKLKAETSLKKLRNELPQADRSDLEREYSSTLAEIDRLKGKLREIPVRTVPVYEHPEILDEAITTARERLLIVSPWITQSVVNKEFLAKIRKLLKRGVKLTIGFGLKEKGQFIKQNRKNTAEEKLRELSYEYENFEFFELGDTHAKIVIKDFEFYVVTSFNWLSFRGDPNRTFREEWGTMVAIEENVIEFYNQILARFHGGS